MIRIFKHDVGFTHYSLFKNVILFIKIEMNVVTRVVQRWTTRVSKENQRKPQVTVDFRSCLEPYVHQGPLAIVRDSSTRRAMSKKLDHSASGAAPHKADSVYLFRVILVSSTSWSKVLLVRRR